MTSHGGHHFYARLRAVAKSRIHLFFLMSRALSDGSAFNVLRAGKLIRGQLRGLATLVDLHLHVFKNNLS